MKGQKAKDFINFGLVIAIIIAINVIASYAYKIWDFTEEKRYTLTQPTKELLREVDEIVYVRVLLDGNLQAGFKRLRNSTLEILKDMRAINPNIEFDFEDPTAGKTEEVNARKEELAKNGILPAKVGIQKNNERSEQLIYPYAIINIGPRNLAINLLEAQGLDISNEESLNNSVSLLEYKFSNAIQKLYDADRPNILITEGNGELQPRQTAFLENMLRTNYDIGRINLDSINQIGEALDLLIVAGPKKQVSQRSQFLIDQYVMNGGKSLWMIDYMNVTLDSINTYGTFIPDIHPIGLEDMFFKYGFRIQPNLILDLQSTRIAQVVGTAGGKAQQELLRYFYHPLIASRSQHPIVKSIDRVNMFFPSTIDTLKTNADIRKEILLSSSNYSRFQVPPVRMNFDFLRYEADESKFNKGPQPVAVLLEGKFESLFKNRVSERMNTMLNDLGRTFKEESVETKMAVISDADFAKNHFSERTQKFSPIGYNMYEQQVFRGNQQFLLNTIEYLLDDRGLLEARGKEVKLRLLDGVEIRNNRGYWQFLNIICPLIFLIITGLIYTFIRRRRYGK